MTKKNHISYGLVISALLIIISILLYVFNMDTASWTRWLSGAVIFAGIIIACLNYAKENEGNVSFGNVFSNGFKAAAVIAIVTTIFSLIFINVVPGVKEKAIEMARTQMEKQGQSDEVIEKGLAMTRKFFTVFLIAGSIFGTLVWGLIASLIGAAVAKKKPQPPASSL